MSAPNGWEPIILSEMQQPYFKELRRFIETERATYNVYPPPHAVFNSFNYCPPEKVKVVIVGQDPYHQPGQAIGLSFAVRRGVKIPPSLQNIFREQGLTSSHGDLTYWAKQGVFLLNRILTVRENQPMSHAGHGWETFTSHILAHLFSLNRPLVFILWGKQAQSIRPIHPNPHHLYLTASHPSPLSAYRGFFGCGHFRLANEFLIKNGESPIDWQLPQ